MSDQSAIEKITNAAAKKKPKPIIKMLKRADEEVTIKALLALGEIGDEDSCNEITKYLENEKDGIRVAACQAALKIDTEYMKTRVRYQMMKETDPNIKNQIQQAINGSRNA